MSENSSRIRPFSNGSEFADWVDRNCENCAKHNLNYPECDIDNALTEAYFGDGTISREIAERMGYSEPLCHEFEQQWYWGVIAEFEGKKALLLGGLNTEDEILEEKSVKDKTIYCGLLTNWFKSGLRKMKQWTDSLADIIQQRIER